MAEEPTSKPRPPSGYQRISAVLKDGGWLIQAKVHNEAARTCPHCAHRFKLQDRVPGRTTKGRSPIQDRQYRLIHDIPFNGRPVLIRVARYMLLCPGCQRRFREKLPAVRWYSVCTERAEAWMLARGEDHFTEVTARLLGLSVAAVYRLRKAILRAAAKEAAE